MIGRLRRKWRQLRMLPHDLFASLHDLRLAIERQNGGLDQEVRALNEQLPRIADTLLQLLLQLRSAEEARATTKAGALEALPGRLENLLQADRDHAAAVSAQLREVLRLQRDAHWFLPSHIWSPEIGDGVRRVLAVLRPFQIGNASKIRLGRANDGGYVVVNDFAAVDAALSLGIDGDVSWDLAVAARGIAVLQFDHTIEAPPESRPGMQFHRLRIAPADGDGAVSVRTLLRERQAAGARRVILKIDIEGDEWACLASVEDALLQTCSQIVCEFHNLHRLAEPEFAEAAYRCFSRLCTSFFVCHVHANNCGNVYNIGNVMVPDTLEVTFANRACYQPVDSLEIFPTPIDMPNQPGRADIFLGAFRFAA